MMRCLIPGAVALVVANAAVAQDEGWTFNGTLNLWLPTLTNRVDTPFGSVGTETSASDLLDDLNFVYMGSLAAQNGRFGLAADLMYIDLSSERDTPFAVFGGAEADVRATVASAYGLYRLTTDPQIKFDIGAGLRAFDLELDLALTPGIAAGRSLSLGDNWIDPVIAARVIAPLNEKWSLFGFADFGGTGGGDQSWQVIGAVRYDFNDRWFSEFGYRMMEIDREVGGQDVSVDLGGPLAVVGLRF